MPKRHCLNCLNFFPVQCCFKPLGQHCIGSRLHKPLTLNGKFFVCKVVWSLSDNIAQGFYLCNVVARVLRQHCTGFFLIQSYLERLGKDCIGFSAVQCCPKSIKTTLHKIFSDAKLSGAFLTALNKVFTCAMLSQEY